MPLDGRTNHFTAGAAYNANQAHFIQSTQFGYLTPDRGVATRRWTRRFRGRYAGFGDAVDARVDLTGRTHVWSVFATDTMEILPAVNLTLSGRYDASKVKNRDALLPSGPGSLTGDHTFSRFNPAIGLTWSPNDALTAYVGYNEGSRAPSAIELGCSDPENPCRLPNALAGDPPLKPGRGAHHRGRRPRQGAGLPCLERWRIPHREQQRHHLRRRRRFRLRLFP